MEQEGRYSDAIGAALLSYITAVCSAVVSDLKLCLTAYHTHYSSVVPHFEDGSMMRLNYNVIKYPLPGNAFLMVIQDAHSSNLFQVASTCTSARTRYVFYCIGDIRSKKIPSFANYFSNYDSVEDYTLFVLFGLTRDRDRGGDRYQCSEAMQYVDLRWQLDAIFDENPDERIDKARLVEHFEAISKLCVKYSPAAIANSIDLASTNTTRKLGLFHQMFSGSALSLFGQSILNKELKDTNRCPDEEQPYSFASSAFRRR